MRWLFAYVLKQSERNQIFNYIEYEMAEWFAFGVLNELIIMAIPSVSVLKVVLPSIAKRCDGSPMNRTTS